ncbi:MAG: PP2C family protein-serine/threonine phosphatase [Ignavibacteria bacterium]
MKQRKFYKTIETIASRKVESFHDLLNEVLNQIVANQETNVSGGRIWKLEEDKKTYKLLFQTGNVPRINENFRLHLDENPIFKLISRERTILTNETNVELLKKGIFRYSATGIGNKIKIGKDSYYQFLMALNSEDIDEELRYTLNIVSTVLTSKLFERRLSKHQQHLIADIDKAKELQKSILPEHEYRFHNYDLFGVTIPAENLGGDFFDYLRIGDNEERLGIVVGDAASKGISAAAEAMYVSGAVRMASTFEIKISPFMFKVNHLINKIFSDDRFSTMFYGEISCDKKGLFLYANAGHSPPIYVSKQKNTVTLLEPTGPLLGVAPNAKFDTDSLNFKPGDILVLYSDGITEAANDKYEFYEEERLKTLILDNIDLSPKELVYTILDDVNKFSTSNSKYQDDKTLVVIKKREN